MEYITEYLKRNIKVAYKNVIFHYRQYICFFIAIFIVQLFFGIITISSDNSNDVEYAMLELEYDYHLMLKDLNATQFVTLVNDEYTVFTSDHVHDIVRYTERKEKGAVDPRYDVYIRLVDDEDTPADTSLIILQNRYFAELAELDPEGLHGSLSPLMSFDDNLAANTVFYVVFAVVITAVSAFLLMSLYYIRLNHFKFVYGIYMSFGAGYKKLVETSFWEMMTISGLTFIPASVCSILVNLIIFKANDQLFNFYPSSLVKIFAFSFILSAISVLLPMKWLSVRTPMSLIIAEDNSNLVISPRVSSDIRHSPITGKYERLTMRRFVKYSLKLVATACVFSVLFMCALFYTYMYDLETHYDKPQFTLSFTEPHSTTTTVDEEGNETTTVNYDGQRYTPELRQEIFDLTPGIVADYKGESMRTPAYKLTSHILVDESSVLPFTDCSITYDSDTQASLNISYIPADAEIIEYLERYDISGDPTRILSEDKHIIISDSLYNSKNFDFEVGDTIQLAKFVRRKSIDPQQLSGNKLLRSQLKHCVFEYEEYTIAAVIHNDPTTETLPIYMSIDDFEAFSGDVVDFNSVDLFIDPSLSIVEVEAIYEELRQWCDNYYTGITVTNTHYQGTRLIELAKQRYAIYTTVAVLILFIAPLIWFFSQTLFYQKRENEYTILRAFGAKDLVIRKLHIVDGIYNAIIGGVFCTVMNLVGVFAVYKLVNVAVPMLFMTKVRYEFYLPPLPFILSILLSAACGFLSSYLPWLVYKKKLGKQLTTSEYDSE